MRGSSIPLLGVAVLMGCAGSGPLTIAEVREKIASCSTSEDCWLIDQSGNRQMLTRSEADKSRPNDLCVAGAEIVAISNETTDRSAMFKARCVRDGKKTAQVTLWYFPDGRYNLTVEDCLTTECAQGWFAPI